MESDSDQCNYETKAANTVAFFVVLSPQRRETNARFSQRDPVIILPHPILPRNEPDIHCIGVAERLETLTSFARLQTERNLEGNGGAQSRCSSDEVRVEKPYNATSWRRYHELPIRGDQTVTPPTFYYDEASGHPCPRCC